MGGLLAIIRLSITVSNAECLIAELVRDKRVFASTEVTKAANSLTSCVPSLPTPRSPKMAKTYCMCMQQTRVLPGLEPGTSRN